MNIIYTVSVAMSVRVAFMGGKLMYAQIDGEKTCNFTNVEEADKFATAMRDKGYEVEMGLVRADAEAAIAAVADYHKNLGRSFARPDLNA